VQFCPSLDEQFVFDALLVVAAFTGLATFAAAAAAPEGETPPVVYHSITK